jgi:hypothetical protein
MSSRTAEAHALARLLTQEAAATVEVGWDRDRRRWTVTWTDGPSRERMRRECERMWGTLTGWQHRDPAELAYERTLSLAAVAVQLGRLADTGGLPDDALALDHVLYELAERVDHPDRAGSDLEADRARQLATTAVSAEEVWRLLTTRQADSTGVVAGLPAAADAGSPATRCACGCGQALPAPPATGRPGRYATQACRARAYRARQRSADAAVAELTEQATAAVDGLRAAPTGPDAYHQATRLAELATALVRATRPTTGPASTTPPAEPEPPTASAATSAVTKPVPPAWSTPTPPVAPAAPAADEAVSPDAGHPVPGADIVQHPRAVTKPVTKRSVDEQARVSQTIELGEGWTMVRLADDLDAGVWHLRLNGEPTGSSVQRRYSATGRRRSGAWDAYNAGILVPGGPYRTRDLAAVAAIASHQRAAADRTRQRRTGQHTIT